MSVSYASLTKELEVLSSVNGKTDKVMDIWYKKVHVEASYRLWDDNHYIDESILNDDVLTDSD